MSADWLVRKDEHASVKLSEAVANLWSSMRINDTAMKSQALIVWNELTNSRDLSKLEKTYVNRIKKDFKSEFGENLTR
jgi:hypothetical protein